MLPLDACGPIARPAGCSMNGRAEQEYEMMVGGLTWALGHYDGDTVLRHESGTVALVTVAENTVGHHEQEYEVVVLRGNYGVR